MCAMLSSPAGENQIPQVALACPSRPPPRSCARWAHGLAALLSNADYAYVGSIDANHLWFNSRFGFRAAEQPRSTTACQWIIKKGEPLLISDAGRDLRFPPDGIPLSAPSRACLTPPSAGVERRADHRRACRARAGRSAFTPTTSRCLTCWVARRYAFGTLQAHSFAEQ